MTARGRRAALPLVLSLSFASAGCDALDVPRPPAEVDPAADTAGSTPYALDYTVDVDLEGLRGLRHPPFPEGIGQLAGAVVQDEGGPLDSPDPWILSHVRFGTRPLLLLSRTIEWSEEPMVDADGHRFGTARRPLLEVQDAVALPLMEPGERLRMGFCKDRFGRPVAAYVRWQPEVPVQRSVRKAWRPDPEGVLVEVSPAGVECRNLRFGL